MINMADAFKIMNHPICAVCNKRVDKFEQLQDFRGDGLIFAAHCHGQSEHMSINRIDLLKIHHNITESRAFVEQVKQLENKE